MPAAPRRTFAAWAVSSLLVAGTFGGAALQAQPATGGAAPAAVVKAGALMIEEPWSRATAPGAAVGGGYLVVENAGGDDRLLGASSPVSARVELHTMSMQDNVMRMRQVEQIDVPAGKRVELRPGGLHLMFIGLKAPLAEGNSFPLTLRFEKAGEVGVTVNVRSMGAGSAGMPHGHGQGAEHGKPPQREATGAAGGQR